MPTVEHLPRRHPRRRAPHGLLPRVWGPGVDPEQVDVVVLRRCEVPSTDRIRFLPMVPCGVGSGVIHREECVGETASDPVRGPADRITACSSARQRRDLLPMARPFGLSVLAWLPLGGGVLTGKIHAREPMRTPSQRRQRSPGSDLGDETSPSPERVDAIAMSSACRRAGRHRLGASPGYGSSHRGRPQVTQITTRSRGRR
jgi:hypothetical protein